MKELFIPKNFSPKTRSIISIANEIIEEYKQQGLYLTLRQLYYQFVARDLIPNKQSEYKRLGSIINDARLAGEIDWRAIEDRTRSSYGHDRGWESPRKIIESACKGYSKPHWERQPYHVEVWVEKEALSGVVENICSDLRVTSFACRGYTSQSEMYSAGLRIREAVEEGKEIKIIHLGDHDPSGIDMTRDIEDRLEMFAFPRLCENDFNCNIDDDDNWESMCLGCQNWCMQKQCGEFPLEIERIALNIEQVRSYNPPPNPAKNTDSRYKEYRKKYGEYSWELDALEPSLLKKLISDAVHSVVDWDKWEEVEQEEENEQGELLEISNRYDDIINYLDETYGGVKIMDIRITMKDGSVKHFEDNGRPGGSYSNKLEYKEGFVVVIDCWGNRTSIPSNDIKEIHQEGPRSW